MTGSDILVPCKTLLLTVIVCAQCTTSLAKQNERRSCSLCMETLVPGNDRPSIEHMPCLVILPLLVQKIWSGALWFRVVHSLVCVCVCECMLQQRHFYSSWSSTSTSHVYLLQCVDQKALLLIWLLPVA